MGLFFFLAITHIINPVDSTIGITLIMSSMILFYIYFGVSIPNLLNGALVNYQSNLGGAGSILGLIYYLWVSIFIFGIGLFDPSSLYVMPGYFLGISGIMLIATVFLMRGNEDVATSR